eukprot:COSAG02_NODE_10621_length_1898_cov_2.988883_1_plen_173_part_00
MHLIDDGHVRSGVATAFSILQWRPRTCLAAIWQLRLGVVPSFIARVSETNVARLVALQTQHQISATNTKKQWAKVAAGWALAQQCSPHPGGGSNCGGSWLPCHPWRPPQLPAGTGFLLHIEPSGSTPSVTRCAGIDTSVRFGPIYHSLPETCSEASKCCQQTAEEALRSTLR